jgi:putative aminopeptidase FrvX
MRKLRHLLLIVGLVLFIHGIGCSQESPAISISMENLKQHLTILASDSLQGRNLFTKKTGLQMAAEYIKSVISGIGLQPAGQNFYQSVELFRMIPDSENSFIEVTDESGNIRFRSDSVFPGNLSRFSDFTIIGKLVFAGYGSENRDKGYNDYIGLDVKNRIVMSIPGRLSSNLSNLVAVNPFSSGAKAHLIVDPKTDFFSIVDRTSIDFYLMDGHKFSPLGELKNDMFEGPKTVFLAPSAADLILGLENKSISGIKEQIDRTGKPASFEMKDFNVKIQMKQIKKSLDAKNIIGIVEGSDPVLKKECVIYTAHYDHVGVDGNGNVFNGADDNASGCAALLEVARAYMKLDMKPKRSVVFAWVSCEEMGKIGSKYYVLHPVIPLEKTVACINMDMVGRVKADADSLKNFMQGKASTISRDSIYIISGKRSRDLESINNKICSEVGLKPNYSLSERFITQSDYAPFHESGIPVLGYTTGIHSDLHQVTDDIHKIDFLKMSQVADLVFRVGYQIANLDKRIRVENKKMILSN